MTSKQFYDEDGTPTIKEYHESIKQFFDYYANHSLRLVGPTPSDDDLKAFETVKTFLKEAYDLAFGDDSLYRDYDPDEVIERLHKFSDRALVLEDNAFDKDQIKLIKHVFDDYVAGHPNDEMVSKKEMESIFEQLDGLGEADYDDIL